MALVDLQFRSKYLSSEVHVKVILPDRSDTMRPVDFFSEGRRYKVLFLLHGTFGNDSDWIRKSLIELYATERNCIVVMPGCLNTEYMNWNGFGPGFFVEDYLIDELMPLIHAWFPASSRKEDNYIGGLSMGAYSSIRIAMLHPDLFAGVIALSGVPRKPRPADLQMLLSCDPLDLARMAKEKKTEFEEIRALWIRNEIIEKGGIEQYIEDSTWTLMERIDPEAVPPFYLAVGEEDFFYPDVLAFMERCDVLGYSAALATEPRYGHEWRFWNKYIEKGMEYFGI